MFLELELKREELAGKETYSCISLLGLKVWRVSRSEKILFALKTGVML